jgi:MFS family permease
MTAISDSSAGSSHGGRDWSGSSRGWWATAVFFLLYVVSFVDRQMLNLLVEPIKQDLGISDFEISLLQGMTFASFYALFGLAIGWMVDHWPRRPIIAVGVFFWSIATVICGLANGFWQLALARMGVAVGEASLAPAAYSLLSDLFPPGRLALPMSIMGAGAGVGGALALVVGGYIMANIPAAGAAVPFIGMLAGWKVAFLLVGLPGLVLAGLVFSIRDPGRAAVSPKQRDEKTISFLIDNKRFYVGHYLGFGLFSMLNYGVSAWMPTFMIRHHGWHVTEAGYAIGVIMFIAGPLGAILMGWLVDKWFSRGRLDAHMRFYAVCCAIQLVSMALTVSANDPFVALAFFVPQVAVAGFTGVAAAALQIGTPANMRGQLSAIYLLVFNLVGLGLGPTAVAVFTDYVFADEAMIGWSLLMSYIIFAPPAAFLMLWAAPAMRHRVLVMRETKS